MKYTYGAPGASDNRAGRIVLQEDASEAQEFFYGPLGEVVKNVRTIVIPQFAEQTYTTQCLPAGALSAGRAIRHLESPDFHDVCRW